MAGEGLEVWEGREVGCVVRRCFPLAHLWAIGDVSLLTLS